MTLKKNKTKELETNSDTELSLSFRALGSSVQVMFLSRIWRISRKWLTLKETVYCALEPYYPDKASFIYLDNQIILDKD